MDIIVVAIFIFVGVVTPVFRKMSTIGRVIPFLGFLMQLMGLAILYNEHIGITFSSLGSGFTVPMSVAVSASVSFPEAGILLIMFLFIDVVAAVAP
jgi:hypothetical protein